MQSDLPLIQAWNRAVLILARFVFATFIRYKQRLAALFLVVVIFIGASSQTAFALTASLEASAAHTGNTHKTSTKPSTGTINKKPAPAPRTDLKSNYTAATDANTPVSSKAAAFLDKITGKVNNQPITPAATSTTSAAKSTFTPHELVNARTATSSEYLNKDGSITKTDYFTPHFYKDNGSWQPIDNTLVEDDNAADSGNVLGKALGTVESWISSPNAYKTKANSWEARFASSDFSGGMVRIKQGNSQVGFSPVNANAVAPTITTNSKGQQVVHYDNLWPNVNVEYTVESDQVKEAIALQNKTAVSQVQFKMIGAGLQKPSASSTPNHPEPAFTIDGALNNQFSIAPANLILNHFGFVGDKTAGLAQTYDNGTLTVGVNSSYLQSLPDKAFPVVIDPTLTSSFGTRTDGNYVSFESGGSTCYPGSCPLYAGGEYDSNNVWQDWRGAFFAPYDTLLLNGVSLSSANLVLVQMAYGNASWVGDTGTYSFQAGEATCLTGYNCMDKTWDSAGIGTSGAIDVTNIYQNYIANGNATGWLMLDGADGTGTTSFKGFDPDISYMSFTYTTKLSSPTFITPPGQVYTDPQASFSLNSETNPNDSTPLLL
jgi:hypothetical protein